MGGENLKTEHHGSGAVIQAGVAVRAKFFEFAPDVRYVRWRSTVYSAILERKSDELTIGIAVRARVRVRRP